LHGKFDQIPLMSSKKSPILLFSLISILTGCTAVKELAERVQLKRVKPQEEVVIKPKVMSSTPTKEKSITTETIPTKIKEHKDEHILVASAILSNPIVSPLREFRAAWIATVDNIDWPSRPGLSSYEQQTEAIEILDFLKRNQFNAIIFQVRPQADALYHSKLEPWSYFLTGEQGVPPDPYYDPLTFWIEEAHKRGLELHAWLNPYRAHHVKGKTISQESIIRKNPEMVYQLEEGYWWMDPSLKETQNKTSEVVMDIVKRYDVDGIHFDDYFYPYPSYNGGKDFPDDKSWNLYVNSGGNLSRGDWRRNGVNTLIERVYKEIKAEKKYVKFGLSPFGIYRPGYPSTVRGFDQYDKLYADAKLWLNKGWIDYFSPQLYWPINKEGQRFPDLLKWWQSENTFQRHLWPGINVVNKNPTTTSNQEVIDEITLTHELIPKSIGAVHWNISSLKKNVELSKNILEGPYKYEALIPPSSWLDNQVPDMPNVVITDAGELINVKWKEKKKNEAIFKWVVYYQYEDIWEYKICTLDEISISLKKKVKGKTGREIILKNIIVTAINRIGNESLQNVIPISM